MPKQALPFSLPDKVRQKIEASPAFARASSSNLINSNIVAANESGELSDEQRAKFKTMQPGLGSAFIYFSIFCVIGFVTALFAYSIVSPALRNWRDPAKALASITQTPPALLIIVGFFALIAAIIALWFLYSLREYIRARSIFKRGAIRQAEGTILWSGKKYIASFPGNRNPLKPWNNCDIDVVIPGRHKFFYLPFQKTNWLLSINRFLADSEALQDLFRVLAEANGFRADALESNRRGVLSQDQISDLKINISADIAEGRVEMTEGVVRKIFDKRLSAKQMVVDAALDIAAQTVLEAVLGAGGQTSGSHTGASSSRQEDNMYTYHYAYEIQGVQFAVSERGYDALIENVRYRAYYLQHSKILVNIEPLAYN